jgi:membrane-associated PAP2 superfamily phosphatase
VTETRRQVLIGLLLTLLITAAFSFTDLDLRLQALAFDPGPVHWPYNDRQPWAWLYHWGTVPGLLMAVAAALGWGLSYSSPERTAWRFPCLYLVVLLALGPGFLINVVGKGLMGRPRPDEITAFGGTWDYLRPFQWGVPGRGRSFLCGHCSMGFLFFGLYFVFRGWQRWIAFALALALGTGLGVARVCQGAHFPSDVLLCGSLLFTLAAAFSPLARRVPDTGAVSWSRGKTLAVSLSLATLIITAFLFSTPVYEEQEHLWFTRDRMPAVKTEIQRLQPWADGQAAVASVEVDVGSLELKVEPAASELELHSLVTGFGFPNAKSRIDVTRSRSGGVNYRQTLRGLFVESHGSFLCVAASGLPWDMHLAVADVRGRIRLDLSGLEQAVILSGLPEGTRLPAGFRKRETSTAVKTGRAPELRIALQAALVDVE